MWWTGTNGRGIVWEMNAYAYIHIHMQVHLHVHINVNLNIHVYIYVLCKIISLRGILVEMILLSMPCALIEVNVTSTVVNAPVIMDITDW